MLLLLLAAPPVPGWMAPAYAADPTPTPDAARLAEPTLPASPVQADYGAQTYWLYCMPCHGDRGQGLTNEFRAVYPPEESYCWDSGCHGQRPYEKGFTLPMSIPPLVGETGLEKFANAAGLYAFIRVAMPFQTPGILDDETYWRVTAHILRENGIDWGGGELGPGNAQQVALVPQNVPLAAPTASLPPTRQPAPATPQPAAEAESGRFAWAGAVAAAIALLVLVTGAWLLERRMGPSR